MKKISTICLLAAALLFSTVASVNAFHKMHVSAVVESGNSVVGEARYGANPVVAAKVKAIAPDGTVLYTSTTDKNGIFTFDISVRCDLKITVTKNGHKGKTELPADELPEKLPVYEGKKK